MLLDIATANVTQMFTNDLSLIGDTEDFLQFDYVGFGININNTDLQEKLTDIRNQTKALDDAIAKRKWLGINYDNRYIDRNLTGENRVLNIALKLKNHVYSYKQDNEYYGLDVEVLYDIARKHGYSLNFIEVDTYDEQIELLKNKTADIAAGYFVIRDDKKEEIAFTEILYPAFTFGVVRYENLEQSTEWDGFYDSVTDFNGEPLGILKGGAFVDLTKSNFSDSSFTELDDFFELYQYLLFEKIEGFLLDEPIAQYFQLLYPERITYFPDNFQTNEYAFGFRNDDSDLLAQFNEFLSNTDTEEIYDKWNVADISQLTIDKDLDTSNPTIIAGFYLDHRPLSFKDGPDYKGFEIELLYKFAKEYNYNIEIIEANIEERITFLEDNKANITGGWFVITDERKERITFSDPIFTGNTVLAVRTDCKKDLITLKVFDKNYNERTDNAAQVNVKFPSETKVSSCVFPDKYNETLLINCIISDLTNINPYSEGFTYNNTEDNIQILYSSLLLDNFFKANSLIEGIIIL